MVIVTLHNGKQFTTDAKQLQHLLGVKNIRKHIKTYLYV